jgi:organic hydroperoxide reductase OsmC/OhrA
MQDYPHRYKAAATGGAEGVIDTRSPGLEAIPAMPPPEFDGPGDKWSPETLLVAAVANCFILTFRAVARASSFEWNALTCEVDGILDRIERQTQFTECLCQPLTKAMTRAQITQDRQRQAHQQVQHQQREKQSDDQTHDIHGKGS